MFEVAKNWPVTSIVDAQFKGTLGRKFHMCLRLLMLCSTTVVGETVVTPGAIVSFTLKLRLTPPGQVMPSPQLKKMTISEPEQNTEETSIDELIGRRKPGADGEEPTPLAHAPHFPQVRHRER